MTKRMERSQPESSDAPDTNVTQSEATRDQPQGGTEATEARFEAADAQDSRAAPRESASMRGLLARARSQAREHPVAFVGAAALAVVLIEEELAIGALLGIAVTALVAVRTGRELRAGLAARGRALLERGRASVGQRQAPQP